jgi:protein-S-isoprenylcysteine O-methyltransferase Ste14
MSTLVIVLRVMAVLALAGPMLLRRHRRDPAARAHQSGAVRAPLLANFAAFGLFFAALLMSSGSSDAFLALPLSISGCFLALAGMALVLRSRSELGAAWSLVPKADQGTDLVTTGPYRWVRHPIYLGLALVALGEATAFDSWLACLLVLCGILPTFAWRARVEEAALSHSFGEPYDDYRRRTGLIIPHLF